MNNNHLGNNPFLFLNNHRNDYFNKIKNSINEQNKDHQGYILQDIFFFRSKCTNITKTNNNAGL